MPQWRPSSQNDPPKVPTPHSSQGQQPRHGPQQGQSPRQQGLLQQQSRQHGQGPLQQQPRQQQQRQGPGPQIFPFASQGDKNAMGEMGKGQVNGKGQGKGQGNGQGQSNGQGPGKGGVSNDNHRLLRMGSSELLREDDDHIHVDKDQKSMNSNKSNTNTNHSHNDNDDNSHSYHDDTNHNYHIDNNNQWDRRLQALIISANSRTHTVSRRGQGLGGSSGGDNNPLERQSSYSRSSNGGRSLKSSLKSAKMSSISGKHILSVHPISTPYQSSLLILPINTFCQYTLSILPINACYQAILSTHAINPSCQHTLSKYPINARYEAILSMHH